MTQVALYDQDGTRFADFCLPELPRVDDEIVFALPNEKVAKYFTVERVVHHMVYKTEHVQNEIDTPWGWEIRLHGSLYLPWEELKCECAQGVTKCPKHSDQPAVREICPKCEAVLGYCAAGVYCTGETCNYTA